MTTKRDERFINMLRDRLGERFHDVRAQVTQLEAGAPGVRRPGGERTVNTYAVHHTAGGRGQTWRDVWRFHLFSRGWDTGGYNALVDDDGHLWLTVAPSRMTYGAGPAWNARTVHVCAIGNYDTSQPPEALLETIWQWLCTCDDVLGYHPWRPHRKLKATACPGRFLASHVEAMARRGALQPRPAHYRDG